jgi:16S rRNA (cytosine1402-N4)-methyltransferase
LGPQVRHIPVMVRELLELLITDREGTYADCTLGCAGHSLALLKALGPAGTLVGLDADAACLGAAKARLSGFERRVHLFHASYTSLDEVLDIAGIDVLDGVMFDLGLSSMQLADTSRGFAHSADGRLDMRFDVTRGRSAAELVNSEPRRRLTEIFGELGELRRPGAISGAIERARSGGPISTTGELVSAVSSTLMRGPGRQRQLAQIFQALRIAVNGELDALDVGLRAAGRRLKTGGVLAVISYHSLEDRMVKRYMRGNKSEWSVLTKKPVTASPEEIRSNPRARSAKLRAAAKVGPDEATSRGGKPGRGGSRRYEN